MTVTGEHPTGFTSGGIAWLKLGADRFFCPPKKGLNPILMENTSRGQQAIVYFLMSIGNIVSLPACVEWRWFRVADGYRTSHASRWLFQSLQS